LFIKTRKSNREDSFIQLLSVIKNDAEIRIRIIHLLKLDSYQRRNVLNRWLEQLRRNSTEENLRQSLSCLFDDEVADKTLSLLINRNFKT
jgi:hypothetical protein